MITLLTTEFENSLADDLLPVYTSTCVCSIPIKHVFDYFDTLYRYYRTQLNSIVLSHICLGLLLKENCRANLYISAAIFLSHHSQNL